MRKPWSISTTVRNPERLREFLAVLKQLEGQEFNNDNQLKYQLLLIQEKLYKPLIIPQKCRKYYDDPSLQMPYDAAEEIFNTQDYEDPPMRGRQSANPLNKLGFAIARERAGTIKITELGNEFLSGNYDIGYIFFKSLLKLQFPNPWSTDFSENAGFNITPFISTLHLMHRLDKKSGSSGLSKQEFSIFIPTLINVYQIDEYIDRIMEFRTAADKEDYLAKFAKDFYETTTVKQKQVNNLFDYGDNIIRYFRLTRYFKCTTDPLGYYMHISLEPSRKTEIGQLLSEYTGAALPIKDINKYLGYISDIKMPELPWEKIENLKEVAISVKENLVSLITRENLKLDSIQQKILDSDINKLNKEQLESYIGEIRKINLQIKENINKAQLMGNIKKAEEMISALKDTKELKKYKPEQFEKMVTEALRVLNDEISIKPNYPVDDDGEPISHSPGNKPDIESYYETFKAICEVTLNTTKLQWIQESQPVMRHLRDFENQNQDKDVFCLFIAPQVHHDTYSQFWISVKYEYDGLPQRIVPMTSEQFAVLLDTLVRVIKQGKRLSHKELHGLYNQIVGKKNQLNSFSEWAAIIPDVICDWQRGMTSV